MSTYTGHYSMCMGEGASFDWVHSVHVGSGGILFHSVFVYVGAQRDSVHCTECHSRTRQHRGRDLWHGRYS